MNRLGVSGVIVYVIAGAALALTHGCGESAQTAKPVAAVMFCDVSGSIDSINIRGMARDVGALVSKFPPASKIVVYPIECTTVPRPMVQIEKPGKPRRPSDVRVYAERARAMAVQAADEVLKVYRMHFADSSKCTCILSTLQVADNYFRQFGDDYSKQLIYFSDMLENCPGLSTDVLSFRAIGFDSARTIITTYTPDVTLRGVGLGIIILPPSFGAGPVFDFPLDKRESVWQDVFRKAGISEDQLARCGFSMTLPVKYDSLVAPVR